MTKHASPRPQHSLLNPITSREPELAARLATLRDHAIERLFDQLAAEAVKDASFRPSPHPPEDVRAMALTLRVLTKMQWNADDLRLFEACWKTASRAELFAEAFEADRNRIEQLVAEARAGQPAASWAAKIGGTGRRKPDKRPAPPRNAPAAAAPATPRASAEPPSPIRLFTADAGNDTLVVLIEDVSRGQLQIAFEHPSGQAQPTRAAQALLRENDFAEDPAGGGSMWSRPLNPASSFQDRISGEWVAIQAAEKMQNGPKTRRG